MRSRTLLSASVLFSMVLVGAFLLASNKEPALRTVSPLSTSLKSSSAAATDSSRPPASDASVQAPTAISLPDPAVSMVAMLGNAQSGIFKVDTAGRLVVDEDARLNIEKLHALNNPRELETKVADLVRILPPPASQQLPDLIERYKNYDGAFAQLFPPGEVPASAPEALLLLDGMHSLRVQYFGQEVAEGFFASEEKLQRELIKLTFTATDPSLTLEEQAEQTQAVYQSMSELKAREKSSRESDAAAKARQAAEDTKGGVEEG